MAKPQPPMETELVGKDQVKDSPPIKDQGRQDHKTDLIGRMKTSSNRQTLHCEALLPAWMV